MTIKQEIALIQRQTQQVRAVRETIESLPPISDSAPGATKSVPSISVRAYVACGGFHMANHSQLRVGTRVRVCRLATNSIGGQPGKIVRVVERGLYLVRADNGTERNVARRDLAIE